MIILYQIKYKNKYVLFLSIIKEMKKSEKSIFLQMINTFKNVKKCSVFLDSLGHQSDFIIFMYPLDGSFA